MAATMTNILCLTILALAAFVHAQQATNYIDVDPPTFFDYNSPLRQPESLRSRPYYDFLSTLYRRDATKSNLFRPYTRHARSIGKAPIDVVPVVEAAPVVAASSPAVVNVQPESPRDRTKRAHVFRPLFVYRQQQIKKQKLSASKRKVYKVKKVY